MQIIFKNNLYIADILPKKILNRPIIFSKICSQNQKKQRKSRNLAIVFSPPPAK
jgi:hypothetical protein